MALTFVGTCGLAGATSGTASSGKISARLTKTSFKPAQAGSVKLIYKFSRASKRFSYQLSFKKGAKWQTVKRVKKTGSFKGSKSMTIKKVFAGKTVKIGRYRLRLSADKGSKLLAFKVVKVIKAPSGDPPPAGSAPVNTSPPTVSGTATQGQSLSASNGSWNNSPTSYTRQWRRCNSSGASCSNISGAASSSYTLGAADVGSTIRVVVTATNSHGSASATSSQTSAVVAPRSDSPRSDPPSTTVKLIFIHHSTGSAWLSDSSGELGIALRNNNYFVSDTNYSWGPDSIGSRTDTGHWWTWFRGSSSSTYTAALYNEFGQHASYSRLASDPDPTRENQIVMFKSCFPNSNISGNPGDPATTGSNPLRDQYAGSAMTVANVKGIYNDLLTYFATRQDTSSSF